MSEAAEFSTDHHMDPDWGPWLTHFSLDVTYPVPQQLSHIIATVFFSNGLQQLDVSEKSKFKYAQELRELLPSQFCQKGYLTPEDVIEAFMRLALSYARRTSRLQSYGNRVFRHLLAHRMFRATTLPAHLQDVITSSVTDAAEVKHWGAMEELMREQDDVPSPGEGVLMRTATTTSDVLAQPISPEVLRWEDKTTQLCHCLLRKLFGSPKPLVQGSRVIIHGMKTEWLNGAEGILGTLHPNGRHYVHLLLPQSAVAQVAGGTVPIPLDNLMWIPGATDVVTVSRLQRAAGGGSKGAQVTPP